MTAIAFDATRRMEPAATDFQGRITDSDHHQIDIFVSCESTICGISGCRIGHRPWWTPLMDVTSRQIISWQLSLQVPSSRNHGALPMSVAVRVKPLERLFRTFDAKVRRTFDGQTFTEFSAELATHIAVYNREATQSGTSAKEASE